MYYQIYVIFYVPSIHNKHQEKMKSESEVCQPPYVFKLYGEVNSVKNTTINICLNDGVYWQWRKLHVSTYRGHLQVLTTFLLKEIYIICLNRVVML